MGKSASTIRIISTTLVGEGRNDEAREAVRSGSRIGPTAAIYTGPAGSGAAFADHVLSWPWTGDFSAARNASLAFAQEIGGDWAMMLDSDERIVCPDPEAVRAFLADVPDRVQVVVAFDAVGTHGRERFFRLPAKHKWIGRTHEAFPVNAGEQTTIPRDLITWAELPKTPTQILAKNERDAAALTIETAERPTDPRWPMYLGIALEGLGRIDEAIEAFRESAARGRTEDAAWACFRAARLLTDSNRHDEAIEAAARGMTIHPGMAEHPWIASLASLRKGHAEHAIRWAEVAQVHAEHGTGSGFASRVGFRSPKGTTDGPREVIESANAQIALRSIHITVTSTGLNAGASALRCTESMRRQRWQRWRHVYIDAASDDDTVAQAWAGASTGLAFDIRREPDRLPLLANLLPIWRSLPDDEVIVWLDGDDWLATDRALDIVALAHAQGALATYGQFLWSDGRLGFAAQCGPSPREEPWRATILRTFRAGLVKTIREDDLRTPDGEWVTDAVDQAVMLPVVEMAAERARFIPNVLAIYNDEHCGQLSATPAHLAREDAEVRRIRSLPRYERIDWPPKKAA